MDIKERASNIFDSDVYMRANFIGEIAMDGAEGAMEAATDCPFEVDGPTHWPDEGEEVMQWWFVSGYLAGVLEGFGETILRIEDGYLWGRKGCGYPVTDDIELVLKAMDAEGEGDA
jgi:hypothetical protein